MITRLTSGVGIGLKIAKDERTKCKSRSYHGKIDLEVNFEAALEVEDAAEVVAGGAVGSSRRGGGQIGLNMQRNSTYPWLSMQSMHGCGVHE